MRPIHEASNFDLSDPINQFEQDGRIVLNAVNFCDEVPLDFQDLQNREDRYLWLQAINDELQSLEENKTWEVVPRPVNKTPIKSKWVFAMKYNGEGSVERYKARLVIKGFAQKKGIDYQETYAPVARLSSQNIAVSCQQIQFRNTPIRC